MPSSCFKLCIMGCFYLFSSIFFAINLYSYKFVENGTYKLLLKGIINVHLVLQNMLNSLKQQELFICP